ncbi:hypothetical protein D3C72_923310 [compost metagenome]
MAAGPSVPPAPGRLAMTTLWPNSREAATASARICVSVAPPAGKGTIKVMGRAGNVAARAAGLSASAAGRVRPNPSPNLSRLRRRGKAMLQG